MSSDDGWAHVLSIPCEGERSYFGKRDRYLAVRPRELRQNFKEGLLEKSKLVWHAYDVGHVISLDEVTIWGI
jgi:hypothetical protein